MINCVWLNGSGVTDLIRDCKIKIISGGLFNW